MKYVITYLLLFAFSFLSGQKVEKRDLSVTVFSCESEIFYEYINGVVFLKGTWYWPDSTTNVWHQEKVLIKDSLRFEELINSFLIEKENEFFYDPCTDDGFHFKIYIKTESNAKKIFVGNYYEKRADELTKLFNSYFDSIEVTENVRIGYQLEDINTLPGYQDKCDMQISDDHKEYLLNVFCELDDKNK